jgi:hypothetical protein
MIPDYQYWQEQATKLRREGLKDLRAMAEKWQTALVALLGIFGTIALFEAPTKLAELDLLPAIALVAIAFVAIGLALRSLWNASHVAIGIPEGFIGMGGPGLEQWTYEESIASLAKLHTARWQGVGALAALLVGFAIVWLLNLPPANPQTTVNVLTVDGAGEIACGKLVRDGSSFTLETSEGKAIDLGAVTSVTVTQACP